MLAAITPEEQRQLGGYTVSATVTCPPTATCPPAPCDPHPWNIQTGHTAESWARLPRKERQHIYGLHPMLALLTA